MCQALDLVTCTRDNEGTKSTPDIAEQPSSMKDRLIRDFDHAKPNMQGHSESAPPSWTRKTSKRLIYCLPAEANVKNHSAPSEAALAWSPRLSGQNSDAFAAVGMMRAVPVRQTSEEAHQRWARATSSTTLEVRYMRISHMQSGRNCLHSKGPWQGTNPVNRCACGDNMCELPFLRLLVIAIS